MHRFLTASLVVCLAGGVAAAQDANSAQTKTATESTTKHSGPGPDTKVKTEKVHGTVKSYEAGKKISFSGPNEKTYSFDLDENAQVEGAIAVGQMASVSYVKDASGVEHVKVISAGTGHSMAAAGSASGKVSHSEMTTTQKGPGIDDTKVKTETVVGVVKKFEAGKKIVVTGPGNKDYSFDLDENASVGGVLGIGDKVKVTYRKGDNGDKVTTVSRYSGK